ncbi:MAG TPA: cation:proton antiporter [Candidatus Deferrimicrobium sp.]|nr:cation:proton antiporter [Candidatus Deferrimicrobium sp.]
METHFITEIVVLLSFSVIIIIISQKLRMPVIVGLLLTGIVIGPSGLKLVKDIEVINVLAEIGIVMLLFTIGLDFSPERIKQIKKFFFWGGGLQVLFTTAIIGTIFNFLKLPPAQSMFYGFLFAMSSTAMILKIYAERSEEFSPQWNISLGISLFQDIAVVPVMVLIRILSQTHDLSFSEFFIRFFLKLLIVIAGILVLRFLSARFFLLVIRTRIKELFVIAAIFACLGMAWLTMLAGFSLALGAFIAGIVISESKYSHQIVSDIIPFKDLFMSIFFISIGMFINLSSTLDYLGLILTLTPVIIIIKMIIACLVVGMLKYPLRTIMITGISLAQVGEFSFVLSRFGIENGLIDEKTFQVFIAVAVLSMMAIPFLARYADNAASLLQNLIRIKEKSFPGSPAKQEELLKGHVIIAGFGVNGQNLARVLKETGIPYNVIELDPDKIRKCTEDNIPAIFGDIASREILVAAGIQYCRVLVIAVSDPAAARLSLKFARPANPASYFIVRARHINEIDELYSLGANQVIPEEFETSIEIFIRTLQEYHIPRNVIEIQTQIIRSERYGMLRGIPLQYKKMDRLMALLTAGTVETFMVIKDTIADGSTLKGIGLREKTNATVIAVVRDDKSYTSPSPDFLINAGDILVIVAAHKDMDQAFRFLSQPKEPKELSVITIK